MTFVMETETRTDYRLERWIAIFLALLFFLPFVARADVRSSSPTVETISYKGADATMQWHCKATGIDGFDQCALLVDGKVMTWRMAPQGEELVAHVNTDEDAIEISRVKTRKRRVEPAYQASRKMD